MWHMICFFVLFYSSSFRVGTSNLTLKNHHVDLVNQRIRIAGLFAIHLKKNGLECLDVINPINYQMVEAMHFAIQQINNNSVLLPTVQIEGIVNDTCGIVGNSVQTALGYSFVAKYFERSDTCASITAGEKSKQQVETVAIIGPYGSEEARAVTDFAGLFNVPVVSPTSTSTLLSDNERFRTFFRTVPSDAYQVKAILHLFSVFEWNFIILLVSDDEYGRSARLVFKQEQNSHHTFCTEVEEVISQQNVETVYARVAKAKKARVIVLFSSSDVAKDLISHAYKNNLRGFTWIASDSWNKNTVVTKGNEEFLQGMIGVSPSEKQTPGFREYLQERLKAFIKKNPTKNNSNKNEAIIDKFSTVAPYETSSTINAVYAIAKAIHQFLGCNSTWCNLPVKRANWSNLVSYLRNIEFESNGKKWITLNESKINHVEYKFWTLKQGSVDKKFEFVDVAQWSMSNGTEHFVKNHRWFRLPNSTCSEVCEKGKYKTTKRMYASCCWNCSRCDGNTYTDEKNQAKCKKCPQWTFANELHTGCIEITEVYLKVTDVWVIVLLSCVGGGIFLLIVTIVIFLCFWNTPVIKASSRSLCYVIILGIALIFLLPLNNVGKITDLRCKMFPLIFGVTIVLNIGTLLIKTNRIARIFSRKIIKGVKVQYLSIGCQYTMVTVLVVVEILICGVWVLIIESPRMTFNYYNGIRFRTCSIGNKLFGVVLWTLYNAGLMILCTYQAFMVRKVPTNYNEAKFIAFTMMTICICIFVYVPVHFSTVGYYRDLVCSFLYIFAGTIKFVCLLAPKLYIVICRPDKNKPMEQMFQSPLANKKLSRYFEAEEDYFPTEHELDLLKIDKYRSPFKRDLYTSPGKFPRNGKLRRHQILASSTILEDISSVSSDILATETTMRPK